MSKTANTTTITSGYASTAQVNANFDAVNTALNNTLSRDGSTPNTMSADLDMNSNDINNVANISANTMTLAGSTVTGLVTIPSWGGAWTTATSYVINDIVRESGSTYICIVAHTSGTFSTDLAAAKWELFAQQGAAGAGTGDMLAANNLSDVANPDTSLSNLGGGTAGIAIFKDTTASDVRTTLGLGGAALVDVIDEDSFATDSAARPPSQQSTKAYVAAQIAASLTSDYVMIQSQDISSVATVDFTTGFDSATYGSYVFVLENVVPATNSVDINVRLSNDGGSNWIAGTSYWWQGTQSGSTASQTGNGVSSWELNTNVAIANTAGLGLSGDLMIYGAGDSGTFTTARWNVFGSTASQAAGYAPYGGSAEAHNGVRFLASSGNLSTGRITMYGRKKV